MSNQRDPILNINPVDPFNPRPTIVQLRFDEPKEVEGKFGPQFLYGVAVDGVNHTLFASKALDTSIYETGAKKDDYVAIVRTGEGKDTRWTARLVDVDGTPIEGGGRKIQDAKAAPRQPALRQSLSAPAAAPRPQVSSEDRLAAFLLDESLYWAAMARGRNMLKDQPYNLDLNAVAFVIYKMAKEHGVELDMGGEPILASDSPF
jgi:hypothetical protein